MAVGMRISRGLGAIVATSMVALISCSPSGDEGSGDEGSGDGTGAAATDSPLTPGCYATARLGTDNLFEGPINSVGNAIDYASTDGTCTGERADSAHTLVHAQSKTAADELCGSLDEGPAGSLDGAEAGYPAEYENVWRCGG